MIKKTILGFLFLCFVISCNDNPSENENITEDFRFEINIKDVNSNLLSDVEISIWNKMQRHTPLLQKQYSLSEIQASTSITFSIPQSSVIELNVYDVENNLHQSLINNKILSAGMYQVSFYHQNDIGTGVYKCKIIARTDSLSTDIIFKDSIYAVMIAPDPEVAKVGITDQSGKFATDKKVLFPSLYELPNFIHTSSASPDSIGTFELSNEIVVALTNSSSKIKYYEKTITNGENIINLIWEDGSDEYPDWGWRTASNKSGSFYKRLDDSISIPIEFKLYQNYPNPFN